MKLLEIAFILLINAFDDFITTDEQELGCLSEEQHSVFIHIRNYIDDVFIEKINEKKPKKEEDKIKEENISLMYLPWLDDGTDAVGIYKKKYHQEMEL